jgi:hypothetical protein
MPGTHSRRSNRVGNLLAFTGLSPTRPGEELLAALFDGLRGGLSDGESAVVVHRLQSANGVGTAKHYPAWLVSWHLTDAGGLTLAEDAVRRFLGKHESVMRVDWDVVFECIGVWGATPVDAVLKIIGMQAGRKHEQMLAQWYADRHIPQELDFPGVLGAARYRRMPDRLAAASAKLPEATPYPDYLAIYFYPDITTADAWEGSPQRVAAYADVTEFLSDTGIVRLWRARFAPFVEGRSVG